MISACQKDDNPIEAQSSNIFKLWGNLAFFSELDERVHNENITIYLYLENNLIDSIKPQNTSQFHFDSLTQNLNYKMKIVKEGYPIFDTIVHKNYSVYDVIGAGAKHYKVYSINLENVFIYKPLIYPKITGYEIKYKKDTIEYNEPRNSQLYYTNIVIFKLENARKNTGYCYSISKTQNFDSVNCIVYNKYKFGDFDSSFEANAFAFSTPIIVSNVAHNYRKGTVLPGEKYYFKVQMVKNGAIREKDSRELGEPLIVETTAPLD